MKNQRQFCYVYYSPKGFEKHDEYGHPEIRIYELRWDEREKEHHLGDEMISFISQVDREQRKPYGLHFTAHMHFGDTMNAIMPFLKDLSKLQPGFYGYKQVIRMIRKRKIPRYVNTGWDECISKRKDYGSAKWIPWKYRKAADAYIDAVTAGIKLAA